MSPPTEAVLGMFGWYSKHLRSRPCDHVIVAWDNHSRCPWYLGGAMNHEFHDIFCGLYIHIVYIVVGIIPQLCSLESHSHTMLYPNCSPKYLCWSLLCSMGYRIWPSSIAKLNSDCLQLSLRNHVLLNRIWHHSFKFPEFCQFLGQLKKHHWDCEIFQFVPESIGFSIFSLARFLIPQRLATHGSRRKQNARAGARGSHCL